MHFVQLPVCFAFSGFPINRYIQIQTLVFNQSSKLPSNTKRRSICIPPPLLNRYEKVEQEQQKNIIIKRKLIIALTHVSYLFFLLEIIIMLHYMKTNTSARMWTRDSHLVTKHLLLLLEYWWKLWIFNTSKNIFVTLTNYKTLCRQEIFILQPLELDSPQQNFWLRIQSFFIGGKLW